MMREQRSLWFRRSLDYFMKAVSILSTLFGIFFLAWILLTVFKMGFKSLNWAFFVEPTKPYGIPDGGIANAILGTAIITSFAALIGVPLGMLGGIYLSEFGGRSRIGNWIRFSANVMMGIPSIVVGLFVYTILVVTTKCFSGFAGSVALAIIMFPVVLRTTEDMLSMVPNALRESALALGTPRWRATLGILFRSARAGLITGILLSIARVSGETAPLLFTALWSDSWPMASFITEGRPANLFSIPLPGDWWITPSTFFSNPTANMTVTITEYATNSPFETMHVRAWGASLLITLAVLVLNVTARGIFREAKK